LLGKGSPRELPDDARAREHQKTFGICKEFARNAKQHKAKNKFID